MKVLTAKLQLLAVVLLALFCVVFLSFFLVSKKGGRFITIATKNDTEQHILGEILAQLIEKTSDIRVIRRFNLEGTTICFHAMLSGTSDLTVEYTGTALLHVLKMPLTNEDLYPIVKQEYERRYALIWLDPFGFSNHYTLIAPAKSGISKISQIGSKQTIAYDPEFSIREEAMLLQAAYPNVGYCKLLDQVLLYFSLLNGSVDVISGWATAGQLMDPRFQVLEDDLRVLPRYEVSPVIRKAVLEKFPELKEILSLIRGVISEEEMRFMNHEVEFYGKGSDEVAREFINKIFNNL